MLTDVRSWPRSSTVQVSNTFEEITAPQAFRCRGDAAGNGNIESPRSVTANHAGCRLSTLSR